MLEDFTHRTLEINRGRLFINNMITLSSESSNATSGAHCIHLCYTVCVYLRCRNFLPKCFSIEKLRLQEAQYWLFLNRDLFPLLLLHLYKQIFFSYVEKFVIFAIFNIFLCPKKRQIILWLWCMNWNNRVRSELEVLDFKIFRWSIPLDSPTKARSEASVSVGAGYLLCTQCYRQECFAYIDF
jgi:hypothetical protein